MGGSLASIVSSRESRYHGLQYLPSKDSHCHRPAKHRRLDNYQHSRDDGCSSRSNLDPAYCVLALSHHARRAARLVAHCAIAACRPNWLLGRLGSDCCAACAGESVWRLYLEPLLLQNISQCRPLPQRVYHVDLGRCPRSLSALPVPLKSDVERTRVCTAGKQPSDNRVLPPFGTRLPHLFHRHCSRIVENAVVDTHVCRGHEKAYEGWSAL